MTTAFIKLEKFNVKKYIRLTDEAQKKFNKNPTQINKRGLNNAKKGLTTAGSNLGLLQKNINPYLSPSLLDVVLTTLEGYALTKTGAKITKVKMLGTQRFVGNKIVTDIGFFSGGRSVGIAKGVTITRGAKGTTFTLGRAGKVIFKGRKLKLAKIKSFAGIEESVSRRLRLMLRAKIKLASGGTMTVIRNNLKGLAQGGFGRVISAKGTRLFTKSGARVIGLNADDFASISAQLSFKDLSLIVGKAITKDSDKVRFIALIKGTSRGGKLIRLSNIQRTQFKAALQKVTSSVAASQVKTKTLTGLTATQSIAASAFFVRQAIKSKVISKPVQVTKPSVGAKSKPVIISKTVKSKVKPAVVLATRVRVKQGIAQLSGQQQRIKQRIKQVTRERQKLKTRLQQKSLQQQSQRLRLRLKTIQQQKTKLQKIRTGVPLTNPQMRLLKIPLPIIRRKRVIVRKKLPQPVPVFNVYGKSGKKFLKLNVKPLKKNDALDKGSFAIDHTTSRQFKIVPVGKRIPGALRKGERNYFNRTKQKFRPYKIKRGKKFVIKPRYIEKRKYGIDTRGEKSGLSVAKHLKQQRRRPAPTRKVRVRKAPNRITPKRSISPVQRQVMLRNLARARKIHFQNLRRPSAPRRAAPARRKPSPAQLSALARGRLKLRQMRRR